MAKPSDAQPTAGTPGHGVAGKENSLSPGEKVGVRADKKIAKPNSRLDTRVVYCGDNLESLAKLPDACVDLMYIEPPFNSNRNGSHFVKVMLDQIFGENNFLN